MDKIAFFYNLGCQMAKEADDELLNYLKSESLPEGAEISEIATKLLGEKPSTKQQLKALVDVLTGKEFKGFRGKTVAEVFKRMTPLAKGVAIGAPVAGLGALGAGGYGAYKALKPKSKKEKILEALGLK